MRRDVSMTSRRIPFDAMRKPPRRLPPVRSAGLVGRFLPRLQFDATSAYRRWDAPTAPRSIVVVGDLQRTILAEQLYLGRRQNDAVRTALVRAVCAEEPDVLLLLGDQVADGASDREWAYFDELMRELRERDTAVHALLGNHDYSRFDRARSEENFLRRFTWARPAEPELVRFGEIAYVGLDSNFGMLGPERTRRQVDAYRSLLGNLDGDPSVRGVIVASHHPPFSNSRLSRTEPVIEYFAEPFLKARKTRLYLSAHVHSYERFEQEGKSFVVSGGGGGPRRKVDVSDARRWRNDVFRGSAIRPFHYLRLGIERDAITVATKMLDEPVRFVVGDAFRVEL
jgi:predicted MPP superfamily phosphohydrolase